VPVNVTILQTAHHAAHRDLRAGHSYKAPFQLFCPHANIETIGPTAIAPWPDFKYTVTIAKGKEEAIEQHEVVAATQASTISTDGSKRVIMELEQPHYVSIPTAQAKEVWVVLFTKIYFLPSFWAFPLAAQ
jgi:hypothetical protein